MTRQAVEERYPEAPEGFSFLREYDPTLGMNFFRVKFTISLEQAVTDELLGASGVSPDRVWNAGIQELTSHIMRRFG